MNNDYDYQEMVFSVDAYGGDYEKMWGDIGQFIRILINDGYQCRTYDDLGADMIVVQFDYRDEEISNGQLRWCTWEEAEMLEQCLQQKSHHKRHSCGKHCDSHCCSEK